MLILNNILELTEKKHLILQQQMKEEMECFMKANMQSMLKAIEEAKQNCESEMKYMEGI